MRRGRIIPSLCTARTAFQHYPTRRPACRVQTTPYTILAAASHTQFPIPSYITPADTVGSLRLFHTPRAAHLTVVVLTWCWWGPGRVYSSDAAGIDLTAESSLCPCMRGSNDALVAGSVEWSGRVVFVQKYISIL